mgnify:CR=1 FL=1
MARRLPTLLRDLEQAVQDLRQLQPWPQDLVWLALLDVVSQLVLPGQLLVLEVPALDLEVVSQALLEALEAHLASQVVVVPQAVRVCCP